MRVSKCLVLLILSTILVRIPGVQAQGITSRTFDPEEIRVQTSVDVDIVYHVLAHFSLPGDPANLYSEEYVTRILQAKKDLETGLTKLDQHRKEMEPVCRQHPRLRFLNLALFMADDYSSFKQSLLKIDDQFSLEPESGNKETLEERRLRDSRSGLIFGNTRRLIPLYQKRFPDPAERQFVKLFAECMDDEYSKFYKIYREARTELDQSCFERFMEYWKSEGLNQVKPWAARSGVNVFNVYLSAVLKGNGRGVPVNEEQRVIFNVVAPLPETQDQTVTTLFVIMHETTHRLTDPIVEATQPAQGDDLATIRENTVFHADLLYVKSRYPTLLSRYMKFFLNLSPEKQIEPMLLEDQFHKTYPLSPAIQTRVGQFVKSLF